MPAQNVDITLTSRQNTCKLTLYNTMKPAASKTITVTYGNNVSIPDVDYIGKTPSGYTFRGWSLQKDGSTIDIADKASSLTAFDFCNEKDSAVTLYTVFTKNAPKNQSITGVSSAYTKTLGSKPFVLKAKDTSGSTIKFTSNNKKVATVASNGKVTIKGIGTAKITISGKAKGEYKKCNKTITVKVLPKKMNIKNLSYKGKTLKITWTKDSKVTGYQIRYSKKANMKSAAVKTIIKNKTTSYSKKNLKAGKYYTQIRSYKTVHGKKYYSDWSKTKTITIKK